MTEQLKTFRDAARVHIRLTVMGTQTLDPTGTLPSQIGDDFVNLQAGEKGFQLLVWQIDDSGDAGSNSVLPLVGVQIRVLRQLGFPGDETVYLDEEMFLEQRRILERQPWRDLDEVQELDEPPAIPDAPERNDNMVSYTVALQLRLNPT